MSVAHNALRRLDPCSPFAGPTPGRPRFSAGFGSNIEPNPAENALMALAATQHGLFLTAQACKLGVTKAQLETGQRRGRWANYRYRGVRGIAGIGDWPARALMAGVLATWPDSYASHRAGGWLWALRSELWVPEVSVIRGRAPSLPGLIVHRSSDLDRTHLTKRLGIPTTSPLRVMVDAGAVMPERDVRDMLDRGRALKLFTPMAVLAELERVARKGRSGVGPLRRILDEVGVTGSHAPSVLEAKMRRIIERAGLPDPICEMIAGPHGEYRLDFPFPDALLDVEVDGWTVHSSFDASHLDKTRQNKLTREGYGFLRYDWTHVTCEADATVREIRAVYFRRLALFSAGFGSNIEPN
ncbi:MAG TPA: DUF559 domain-containing protein, partial [Acidimicrobiales bacterium]|nr:DUF559 domain-containing protein [Acidimicrobiales bacterium]